jgi:hypothetical protein
VEVGEAEEAAGSGRWERWRILKNLQALAAGCALRITTAVTRSAAGHTILRFPKAHHPESLSKYPGTALLQLPVKFSHARAGERREIERIVICRNLMISYQMQSIFICENNNCGCVITEDHSKLSHARGNL